MNITSWNVNGLRALLSKGGLASILTESTDVFMFQEIKSRPDQISSERRQAWSGYHEHWHPAEKPGYSGVAVLSRSQPVAVQIGLGNQYFDREGRAILMRFPEFYLINAYFPSGQRGHDRVNYKLEFYAALLDICDLYHQRGEQIIIGGDFNTAHQEIDLRYPKQNQKTSGFLPEERMWVDRYLGHGFVDAFRAIYPGRVQYTWWTYRMNARQKNVGWRLDYFLVSANLLPRISDVQVHETISGSDHCPVTLSIDNG